MENDKKNDEIIEDFDATEEIEKAEESTDEVVEETAKDEYFKKQAAESFDRLQRLAAEFDNFRKRTIKEKSMMYDSGVFDTVEKLLPIIDNFERAMVSATDSEDSFVKGMNMIYKLFLDYTAELGITEIPAQGEQLNPEIHCAVAHVDDENAGENEIIEVIQKGYFYKERVLRHSMVKVAN